MKNGARQGMPAAPRLWVELESNLSTQLQGTRAPIVGDRATSDPTAFQTDVRARRAFELLVHAESPVRRVGGWDGESRMADE